MTEERGMFGSLENVLKEEDPELAHLIGIAYALYKGRHPEKEDFPLPVKETVTERIIVCKIPVPVYTRKEAQQSPLDKAMDEYRKAWSSDNLNPDLVQNTWKEFWDKMSGSINIPNLTVPQCDRSKEELAELKNLSSMAVWLPDEIMKIGFPMQLMEMFKSDVKKQKRSTRHVIRQSSIGGWVDVEMTAKPPYSNWSAQDVLAGFSNYNSAEPGQYTYEGQRLPTYMVASVFRKLLIGDYFDEGTESSLLGSRITGDRPIRVTMQHGYLSFRRGLTRTKDPMVGFRSERRKRSAT